MRNTTPGTKILLGTIALCAAVMQSAHSDDISGTSGMTYSLDQTFVDGDNWANGNVTVESGVTVTVPGGATLTYDADAIRYLYGAGTFRNEGIFLHDTSTAGDNLRGNGTGRFENAGTYQFDSGGDFRLANNAFVFENTGLIHKSQGSQSSSNDPSYIFRDSLASTATFLNSGNIQVDTGHLNIAGGTSTGGTFTVNGGLLSFSGPWTQLTGMAAASGGSIRLENEDPAGTTAGMLTAAATTTVLNISGDGIQWVDATIDLNDNLLRNDGILHIDTAPVKAFRSGDDTFLNSSAGTVNWTEGEIDLNGNTFSNEGALNIANGGLKTLSDTAGDGTFENAAAGTVDWGGTSGSEVTLNGADFVNKGQFNLNDNHTKEIAGSGKLVNDSQMTWNAGGLELSGTTLENNGTFIVSGADNRNLYGDGTFVNNGTYRVAPTSTSADNVQAVGPGKFVNNGLYDITTPGDFELGNADYTFENTATGIVRKSGGPGDASLFFKFGDSSTGGTFDNKGTLEVLTGEIEFRNGGSGFGTVAIAQYDSAGKALTGGTWIIRDPDGSGGGSALLDLQPANAGIESIGAGAAVELTGPSAVFSQLTQHLNHVAGSLTLNDLTFNVDDTAGLTIDGGILNWQGGGINLSGGDLVSTGTVNMTTGTTKRLSGSHELVNDGQMTWNAGNFVIESDVTVQNNGTFRFTGTTNPTLSGSGEFINEGTFEFQASGANDNLENAADGGRFTNRGLFDFQTSGDMALTDQYTFANEAGGILRKSAGSSDYTLFFVRDTSATATFDNQGAVEVLVGEMELRTTGGFGDIDLVQYHDVTQSLTGGTWIIRDPDGSGGGSALLDLQPANAGIVTLGANASVELTGPNSLFPQLTGSMNEVAGRLEVNDRSFNIPGGELTLSGVLAGTGTFVGDLIAEDGAVIGPGADWGEDIGTMTINSDVTMENGSTLSLDINGSADYDRLVFASGGTLSLDGATLDLELGYAPGVGESLVIVEGFDALGGAGIFAGLPDGASVLAGSPLRIFYNANNITLTGVPEPGTATLTLVSLLLAGGFVRRRRSARSM